LNRDRLVRRLERSSWVDHDVVGDELRDDLALDAQLGAADPKRGGGVILMVELECAAG